jgi:hypothetical protein
MVKLCLIVFIYFFNARLRPENFSLSPWNIFIIFLFSKIGHAGFNAVFSA